MISILVALLSAIWFIVLKFKKVRHRLSEVMLGAFYLWGALMMSVGRSHDVDLSWNVGK